MEVKLKYGPHEEDALGGGVDVEEAALAEHVVDVGDEGAQVGALVQGLAKVWVLAFSSYLFTSTSAVTAASMSALMAASMSSLVVASTSAVLASSALEAVSDLDCSANIIHRWASGRRRRRRRASR